MTDRERRPNNALLGAAGLLVIVLVALLAYNGSPHSPPRGMVFVPGGRYVIGSGLPGELPSRDVTLKPFYIDQFPVTVGTLKEHAMYVEGMPPMAGGSSDWPLTSLRYSDVEAVARSLGKRLPTEAEWEAAARGLDGRIYPWGNTWDPSRLLANYTAPMPVGGQPTSASPCGAQDMVGNVFQWTATHCRGYPGGPPEFRDDLHVLKAGAWPFMEKLNRCSFRTAHSGEPPSSFVGFRCVQPLDAEDANLKLDSASSYSLSTNLQEFSTTEEVRQLLSYELDPRRTLPGSLMAHIVALRPGLSVADVGAGVGFLSFMLSRAVGPHGTVYATDVDHSVLEFTLRYAQEVRLTNLRIVDSAPDDIRLPAGSCDEVYLLGTVRFLQPEQCRRFFWSCNRALKPGGTLIILDGDTYPNISTSMGSINECGFHLLQRVPIQHPIYTFSCTYQKPIAAPPRAHSSASG